AQLQRPGGGMIEISEPAVAAAVELLQAAAREENRIGSRGDAQAILHVHGIGEGNGTVRRRQVPVDSCHALGTGVGLRAGGGDRAQLYVTGSAETVIDD